MHKCAACIHKGEHQEMGFRPVGVCNKERDLIKAGIAYRAPECPFVEKKTDGAGEPPNMAKGQTNT